MGRRTHFLNTLIGRPSGDWMLLSSEGSPPVADRLETAFDQVSRTRGLLGRTGLPDGAALILAPCTAIHTFRMRFPIDVIFAARDGKVLKVRRAMPPSRVSGALGAFAVIEMAAGAIDRARLTVGEKLVVAPADTNRLDR